MSLHCPASPARARRVLARASAWGLASGRRGFLATASAVVAGVLLMSSPLVASGDTLTPGQLLEKIIPRVQQPKKVRRSVKAAPKPAPDIAAPADTAAAMPTPRPRPDHEDAKVVAAIDPLPAAAAEPAPPPLPAARRALEATAIQAGPTNVGTLSPPLGAEALAFAPPVAAMRLQPEPAAPVDPSLSPLGIVLPPKGMLPATPGIDHLPDDHAAADTEDDGPPLPRAKPGVVLAAIIPPRAPLVPETLAACKAGLAALKIAAKPMPALQEGACGAPDPLSVSTLDDGDVALQPAATINCEMASTLALWLDGDVQSAAVAAYGSRVTSLRVLDSYSCRGRNRVVGAQLSEHAFMNAIDVGAFEIGGRWVTVEKGGDHTDKDTDFIETVRHAACTRFMTVLGPGSDGYHENHLHLDMRHRGKHGDSRYCH